MPPLRSIASRRTPEVGVGVGNSSTLPVFASTRPSLCPSSSAKYTALSRRDAMIPYAFALGVGTGYSVILPVAGSSRPMRLPLCSVMYKRPSEAQAMPCGREPSVGIGHSTKRAVFGSNLPSLLAPISANQMIPSGAATKQWGALLGVGMSYSTIDGVGTRPTPRIAIHALTCITFPLSRVPCFELETRHLDPVDNELHGNGAQHEPHESRQDPHARLAELLLHPRCGGERDVGQKGRKRDCHVYPDGRHHALRGSRQHHDRRDRPWPGEHRDAQRHDTHVLLLDPLGFLDRRLPLLTAARLDHVERVEADQDAAGDLEGPDGDAEQTENEAAAQGERRQRDGARPGAPLGHEPAYLGWVPGRHGEERRNRGEGIDDEQDRREDEEQVLEHPERVAHIATCTTRSLPARFAAYIVWSALRSSSSVPASVPETATTPMLAVKDGVPRNTVRMPLTSRLAAACATSPSVSGIKTPNSSPPSRPTTSACRTAPRIASATRRSTASPVAWPCASFTDLKSSRSR